MGGGANHDPLCALTAWGASDGEVKGKRPFVPGVGEVAVVFFVLFLTSRMICTRLFYEAVSSDLRPSARASSGQRGLQSRPRWPRCPRLPFVHCSFFEHNEPSRAGVFVSRPDDPVVSAGRLGSDGRAAAGQHCHWPGQLDNIRYIYH